MLGNRPLSTGCRCQGVGLGATGWVEWWLRKKGSNPFPLRKGGGGVGNFSLWRFLAYFRFFFKLMKQLNPGVFCFFLVEIFSLVSHCIYIFFWGGEGCWWFMVVSAIVRIRIQLFPIPSLSRVSMTHEEVSFFFFC